MLEILLYSYLTSIHIYICGYIFFYIAIDREVLKKAIYLNYFSMSFFFKLNSSLLKFFFEFE